MEVGLSFSIFGKKTCVMGGAAARPEERHFAQLAENGIPAAEILLMEGYLPPGDEAALAEVARWAEAYGVRIHSVHGPSGWPTNGHWIGDPDEATRRRNVEERRVALRGAQQLGARYMIVEHEAYFQWPYWPHAQTPEQVFPRAHQQWLRSFEELLETAAETGVALAVENIEELGSNRVAELLAGLDRSLAGACLDTSHASFGGGLWGELDRLAPYVIGTHLSDNDGADGAEWVDHHWRPGLGAIDWERLVRRIAAESPCECLILEVLDRERPWVTEELAGAIRRIEKMG